MSSLLSKGYDYYTRVQFTLDLFILSIKGLYIVETQPISFHKLQSLFNGEDVADMFEMVKQLISKR